MCCMYPQFHHGVLVEDAVLQARRDFFYLEISNEKTVSDGPNQQSSNQEASCLTLCKKSFIIDPKSSKNVDILMELKTE